MSAKIPAMGLLLALSFPAAAISQAAPGAAPDLTDPEVAHVAVTANTIDVEAGSVAMSKGSSAEVKRFGEMMKRDHAAVNEKAAALAKKLGVTPKDNAVSQSLLAGAKDAKARLEPLQGAEYDRAYVEREITYHQAVLDALDHVLIPTTDNAELKQLLVDVRPAFVAHLAYAKQVGERLHASR